MEIIMDYKEKYKDALEWARAIYPNMSKEDKEDMEGVFPELKESEDERIRKELIRHFKGLTFINPEGVEKATRWLDWLEKQKEFVSADFDDVWETADCEELAAPLEKYSKDAIKKMCHAWYDKGIELERKRWIKKQGEQSDFDVKDYNNIDPHFAKPIDKVEPKFKDGQWIVWKDKCYKVYYNGCGYELVDQNGLITTLEYGTVDESAHLWSIEDVKEGDVLAWNNSKCIAIFKNIYNEEFGCKTIPVDMGNTMRY